MRSCGVVCGKGWYQVLGCFVVFELGELLILGTLVESGDRVGFLLGCWLQGTRMESYNNNVMTSRRSCLAFRSVHTLLNINFSPPLIYTSQTFSFVI